MTHFKTLPLHTWVAIQQSCGHRNSINVMPLAVSRTAFRLRSCDTRKLSKFVPALRRYSLDSQLAAPQPLEHAGCTLQGKHPAAVHQKAESRADSSVGRETSAAASMQLRCAQPLQLTAGTTDHCSVAAASQQATLCLELFLREAVDRDDVCCLRFGTLSHECPAILLNLQSTWCDACLQLTCKRIALVNLGLHGATMPQTRPLIRWSVQLL